MDSLDGSFIKMVKKPTGYITAVAFLLLAIFVFLVLKYHTYNPEAFILSGAQFRYADSQGTKGYDGQFAYYIASDALSAYQYMDEPGKRYQRILFPVLAWLLSLGGLPAAVPWAMLGINFVSLLMTTWIIAAMLADRQANPWFALIYIFYIGALFSLRTDLNEPLAMFLSLSGWYAYQRRHPKLAIVLFAFGGLAKEIGLIFPLVIAIWDFIERRWRKGIFLLSFSFLPYGVLFLFLHLQWGNSADSILPNWLPFSGIAALQDLAFLSVVGIWVLFPIIILLFFILRDWLKRNRAHWNLETFMLLTNMAFLSIMPYQTWEDPLAVFRSALPFLIATIIWMARNQRRLLPFAAALWAPSCIILFVTPGIVN